MSSKPSIQTVKLVFFFSLSLMLLPGFAEDTWSANCAGSFVNAAPEPSVGYVLHRNQDQLPVVPEPHRFTIKLKNTSLLDSIRYLDGIENIEHLTGPYYKVSVAPEKRDGVMETIRERFDGIAHHAYAVRGAKNVRLYLTDEIILRFAKFTKPNMRKKILNDFHLEELEFLNGDLNTVLVRVTSESDANPAKLSDQIMKKTGGLVLSAEPNLINRFQKYSTTELEFLTRWYLASPEGDEKPSKDSGINLTQAWKFTKGKGVTVAVLDNFPNLVHSDLQSTKDRAVFRLMDFSDPKDQTKPTSDDFHHSIAANVAVGAQNNKGMSGVAPQANYLPVRLSMIEDDASLIKIFTSVARQADVINLNRGPPAIYAPISAALSETFKKLATGKERNQKAIIVFSTGNENAKRANNTSSTSSKGESTQEDLLAWNGLAEDPHTLAIGGTPISAPIATGVLALTLAKDPKLDWHTLKRILQESMDKVSSDRTDSIWNVALGTYDERTGDSLGIGYGKLNAGRAVEMAESFYEADLAKRAWHLATQAIGAELNLSEEQMKSIFGNYAKVPTEKIHWKLRVKRNPLWNKKIKRLIRETEYLESIRKDLMKFSYALLYEDHFGHIPISESELRTQVRKRAVKKLMLDR